jgi:hypothetical protein
MSVLSENEMRAYLSRSISSLNRNKLNGLLAEVDLRAHLKSLGFGDRVSRGGWIARRVGAGEFAHQTAVFFPETIQPAIEYPNSRPLPQADVGLHTICATFHQTGIFAYFCAASVAGAATEKTVTWRSIQLGLPSSQEYKPFPQSVSTLFSARTRRYKLLRYKTDTSSVPSIAIAEEFSKENLRVAFQTAFMTETSDVDGILWGQRHTYPLEIKEKTAAFDKRTGDYFGLDVGPFVKLAYYAVRRGNLHSLFIVREIDSVERRNLVNWWFIKFDELSQFASWVSKAGGKGMGGGASSVVCIPKVEFKLLTRENLESL